MLRILCLVGSIVLLATVADLLRSSGNSPHFWRSPGARRLTGPVVWDQGLELRRVRSSGEWGEQGLCPRGGSATYEGSHHTASHLAEWKTAGPNWTARGGMNEPAHAVTRGT